MILSTISSWLSSPQVYLTKSRNKYQYNVERERSCIDHAAVGSSSMPKLIPIDACSVYHDISRLEGLGSFDFDAANALRDAALIFPERSIDLIKDLENKSWWELVRLDSEGFSKRRDLSKWVVDRLRDTDRFNQCTRAGFFYWAMSPAQAAYLVPENFVRLEGRFYRDEKIQTDSPQPRFIDAVAQGASDKPDFLSNVEKCRAIVRQQTTEHVFESEVLKEVEARLQSASKRLMKLQELFDMLTYYDGMHVDFEEQAVLTYHQEMQVSTQERQKLAEVIRRELAADEDMSRADEDIALDRIAL